MNILVVGSGGREHAIAWKMAQSSQVDKVYTAPGNAGTASLGENVHTGVDYVSSLLQFVRENQIGLTVVGPEVALAAGIVDEFELAGLRIFGPTKYAAQLESSKVFAKQFMQRHGIKTADFAVFTEADLAKQYVQDKQGRVVLKADGLAAGKGVIVPDSIQEAEKAVDDILVKKEFGPAGATLVIEDMLQGEEATLLCFCDGKTIVPMVSSQDHKRAFDKDKGPNTGGVGVYAPTPLITPALNERIQSEILDRIIDGLQKDEIDYRGVLYVGLMIEDGEPFVLEFNARFGDPEAQVVIPLLDSDLVDVMQAVIDRRLDQIDVKWNSQHACCVIMTSKGYPGKFKRGYQIKGLDKVEDAIVFQAGTELENGQVVTSGGRVLGVTALADSLQQAIDKAYQGVAKIDFENKFFRTDIGAKATKYGSR